MLILGEKGDSDIPINLVIYGSGNYHLERSINANTAISHIASSFSDHTMQVDGVAVSSCLGEPKTGSKVSLISWRSHDNQRTIIITEKAKGVNYARGYRLNTEQY